MKRIKQFISNGKNIVVLLWLGSFNLTFFNLEALNINRDTMPYVVFFYGLTGAILSLHKERHERRKKE